MNAYLETFNNGKFIRPPLFAIVAKYFYLGNAEKFFLLGIF
jgi:hypothetical protein